MNAEPSHRPLRVLYLDPAGHLWGSERSLLLLLAHLDGAAVTPALCLPPGTPLQPQAERLGVPCLPAFRADLHHGGRLAKLAALWGLWRSARHFRPDVIHVNQAGATRHALFVARRLGVPLVVHVRMGEDCRHVADRVAADERVRFIAISRFVERELVAAGVAPERIDAIYDAIQPPAEPLPERPTNTEPTVGLVARLCPTKGVDLFLEAMRRVVDERPESRAVIVGDSGGWRTPDGRDYLEAMRDRAASLGIDGRVTFTGFRADVEQVMAGLDLLVSASDEEAWGRVLCEALLLGVPVVATAVGGTADIVHDGETGLLVPPRDPPAMARAILRMLADRPAADRMAQAGRRWVLAHCAPAAHARRILEVYGRLTGRGAAGTAGSDAKERRAEVVAKP